MRLMPKIPKKLNKQSIVLEIMQINPMSIQVSTIGKTMGLLTEKKLIFHQIYKLFIYKALDSSKRLSA